MLASICAPAGFFSGTGLRTRRIAPTGLRTRMSLEADEMDTLMPAPEGFYKVPEVSEAAAEVARLLDEDREADVSTEDREAKVAQLFAPPAEDAYLDERPTLIGEIGSAALLEMDEKAGFWPPGLSTDRDAPAMIWVDEYSCVGCRWCACVARNTFTVTEEYGVRRTGLEPQPSRLKIDLPLSRASPVLDRLRWLLTRAATSKTSSRRPSTCARPTASTRARAPIWRFSRSIVSSTRRLAFRTHTLTPTLTPTSTLSHAHHAHSE